MSQLRGRRVEGIQEELDPMGESDDSLLAQRIARNCGLPQRVEHVEALRKGYSDDRKYLVRTSDGGLYLLRLSSLAQQRRRMREFEILRAQHRRGIACPDAITAGADIAAGVFYAMYTFLPGRCLEEAMPDLTAAQQRRIGLASGRLLKQLHEMQAPAEGADWPQRRRAKHERYMKRLDDLGLKCPRRAELDAFVSVNSHLMDSAPVRFQHDDFHPGNLIVDGDERVGVVDFNRCDWGDPIEDFYKLEWFGVPLSICFARGQVEGYLAGADTGDFWLRYTLYAAMQALSCLAWAADHDSHCLAFWQERVERVIRSLNLDTGRPPAWFEGT